MNYTPRNRTIGEYIYEDIDKNEYLLYLYDVLLRAYSQEVFGLQTIDNLLKPKYLNDLLRFADLLSKSIHHSKSSMHKIWGHQIVAILDKLCKNNPTIKVYKYSILTTCLNYQGLSNDQNISKDTNMLEQVLDYVNKNYFAIPFHPNLFFSEDQKHIYEEMKKGHLSYSAPTSQGKSFLMRVFIRERIMSNSTDSFAIIVPTKALINETRHKMLEEIKENPQKSNYRVISSSSDIALEKNDRFIFIMTPERFLYLLNTTNHIAKYVFIDEAHKISSNDKRSAYYYQIISKLSKNDIQPHIVFSSPNIPNPEEYLRLINSCSNKSKYHSDYSPVSQIKFLIDIAKGSINIYNEFSKKFINIEYDSQINLNDIIRTIGKKDKNLIYCNSIQETINLAVSYAKPLKETNDEILIQLSKDIQREISSDYYLVDLIKKEVAYHVGYLPASLRVRIEEAYEKGRIKTLFCTSTLIEGVNLKADNLFITSYKNGRKKFDEVTFRNLIGRVGRINHSLFGNVFLVNLSEDGDESKEYIKLLNSNIPKQKLSIDLILTPSLKRIITDSIKNYDFEISKKPKKTTQDEFEFIRKISTILIDDIKSDSNTLIKETFSEHINDNDINELKDIYKDIDVSESFNTTPDQTYKIRKEILEDSLEYPKMKNGKFDKEDVKNFLKKLAEIYKWEIYEKTTLGKRNKQTNQLCSLPYYAQLLTQWMSGYGLSKIIKSAIQFKTDHPDSGIWINNYKLADYFDPNNKTHINYIIAETLSNIENVILFSIANYFRDFSTEYKRIHCISHFDNDWYEFVEYGTTDTLTIALQRNGYTRETARNIIENKDKYICFDKKNDYADFSLIYKKLKETNNENVKIETEDIIINIPELFV